MQVAITGASGLIGSALARSLRDAGHTVRPVVRRDTDEPGAVRWDPAAGTIDAGALAGVDAVVHLAGAGIGDRRWSEQRKRELHDSRTRGTDLLARALAGLDPRPAVLVSGSAVGYYGHDRGDEVVTELSPPGRGFLAGLVQDWEAAAAPAVEAGIRTVYLRSGIVLDAQGGILPRLALPFRLFVGGRLGSGRQWVSWITLDDEVAAIRFLLDRDDVAGPVNAVAPEPVTNAELARTLGTVLGRPSAVPAPAFAFRLAMGREMADELILASQRARPDVLVGAGFGFGHTDVTAALRTVLGRT
ncbi:MAG TPA: TIGR01777 family oxidoreductase [Acidimicrobiales bacterium]|nr:TIGR01777 family oxidoreductase [Acidimicrobiales bacterium]